MIGLIKRMTAQSRGKAVTKPEQQTPAQLLISIVQRYPDERREDHIDRFAQHATDEVDISLQTNKEWASLHYNNLINPRPKPEPKSNEQKKAEKEAREKRAEKLHDALIASIRTAGGLT